MYILTLYAFIIRAEKGLIDDDFQGSKVQQQKYLYEAIAKLAGRHSRGSFESSLFKNLWTPRFRGVTLF
jgi:hypothetical protein